MQGFQYFSILPVPHYLQAVLVLFINIFKKFMNISNNFETLLNQEVPKTILDGKSTWYLPLLKGLYIYIYDYITFVGEQEKTVDTLCNKLLLQFNFIFISRCSLFCVIISPSSFMYQCRSLKLYRMFAHILKIYAPDIMDAFLIF